MIKVSIADGPCRHLVYDLHCDCGHNADTALFTTRAVQIKLLISLVQLGGFEPPTS
jgi:hypothetical protein